MAARKSGGAGARTVSGAPVRGCRMDSAAACSAWRAIQGPAGIGGALQGVKLCARLRGRRRGVGQEKRLLGHNRAWAAMRGLPPLAAAPTSGTIQVVPQNGMPHVRQVQPDLLVR